jgi:hypothetical protein
MTAKLNPRDGTGSQQSRRILGRRRRSFADDADYRSRDDIDARIVGFEQQPRQGVGATLRNVTRELTE